jgi:hypothetical protein
MKSALFHPSLRSFISFLYYIFPHNNIFYRYRSMLVSSSICKEQELLSVSRFMLILPLLRTAPAATCIFAAGLTVDWSIIHEKEGITSQ